MTSKAGIFSQFVSERWDDRSEKWFKTSCMWIISGVPDWSLQLWTQRKIKFIYPFRYMLRNGVWLPAHKIRASQPTYKYQPKCLTFCVCPCHQVVPYIRSCPFLHFQVVWRCSPPPRTTFAQQCWKPRGQMISVNLQGNEWSLSIKLDPRLIKLAPAVYSVLSRPILMS